MNYGRSNALAAMLPRSTCLTASAACWLQIGHESPQYFLAAAAAAAEAVAPSSSCIDVHLTRLFLNLEYPLGGVGGSGLNFPPGGLVGGLGASPRGLQQMPADADLFVTEQLLPMKLLCFPCP